MAINVKNLILLLFLLLGFGLEASADIVVGRVVDSETKEPLEGVTIIIRNGSQRGFETNNKNERTLETDSLGCFHTFVGDGQNTFTFMLIGYKNDVRTRMGTYSVDTVNLGDIPLKMSDALAKGVKVVGKRKKFYMRGDTVVYDPSAFNLREGERIDRLIKQMPGVDVDENGSISWNGKPIKIIINGEENRVVEEFLPNLAAEAIDKIKVYKKKSRQDSIANTPGEGQEVMDFKIKKDWMEKWYGDVALMGQTERYYNINANGYRLSDKVPVYVYANMGDGNHRYQSGMWGGRAGRLFKQTGVEMRSHDLGVSMSRSKSKFENDKFSSSSWNFMPTFNHGDDMRSSESKTETYLSSDNTTFSLSKNSSYSHRFDFIPIVFSRNYYKDNTSYSYNISANYSRSDNSSSSSSATFNESPYEVSSNPLADVVGSDSIANKLKSKAVNSNENKSYSESERWALHGSGSYSVKINKKGSLSLSSSFSYNTGTQHNYGLNQINYYSTSKQTVDKQYTSSPSNNFAVTGNVSYNVRLGKEEWGLVRNDSVKPKKRLSGNLSASYNIDYNRSFDQNKNYRWMYDNQSPDQLMSQLQYLPPQEQEMLMALDTVNSYRSNQHNLDNNFGLSFNGSYGKWTANLGSRVALKNEQLDYKRNMLDTLARRTTMMPSFNAGLEYKISDRSRLSFSTNYSKSNPSMQSLMNYTDTSDPLYIVENNPGLKGMSSRSFTLGYSSNMPKKQIMMNGSVSYTKNDNSMGSLTRYNPTTGVRRTRYENIRGGHSWRASYSFEWLFAPKFKLKDKLSASADKKYSFLTIDDSNPTQTLNTQKGRNLNNDLSLTYIGPNLDLTVNANIANRHWDNSEGVNSSYNYWDYIFGLQGKWHITNHLVLDVDAKYDGKDGYMSDIMNKDKIFLDAALSWHFLKGQGTLTLGAADILNQDSPRRFAVSTNARSESTSFSIHHYYYLQFAYHFDKTKKKGKKSQSASGTGVIFAPDIIVVNGN